MMTKFLSATALAASLVATPAMGEPMTVTGQPMFQERVSFADLDLNKWAHRKALHNRVRAASYNVCAAAEGPIEAEQHGFLGSPSCTEAAYDAARPQIVSAIERARSGQVLAMSLVVSVPRLAR